MPNKIKNPNSLVNEAPTVIGMMSVVIEGGGSLDTAVRDVAKNGPERSSSIFTAIIVKADTRQISDISYGLSNVLASLPVEATAYRRAIHMVMAASTASDRSERKRMLEDASEIALNGLKEIGESYSTSLSIPCMTIFGLGIMVPMVLMSILPMLSIGGIFGNTPVGTGPIVLITLIIIPIMMISLILSVKEKNPFLRPVKGNYPTHVLPIIILVPATLMIHLMIGNIQISLLGASLVSCSVSVIMFGPHVRSERTRERQEMMLQESVFELGNRMIAGENYETAVVEAVGSRSECVMISENISTGLKMCRGDVCSAISESISRISSGISVVLCDVYRYSQKDTRDAGRLAVSVGRQLQDQDTVRKGIRNKLKSMTDMMTGTAMIFAPLVLGMSITMMQPISKVMDGVELSGTSTILSIYLIELCILISLLTSVLNGRTDIRDIVYRIGLMLPISMTVFILCSAIGL